MQSKKNPKYDLRLHYRKALELGLVGALMIVTSSFYVFRGNFGTTMKLEAPDINIEVEDIPPTEQLKRPPAPARPALPIPSESEDIPEDETINETDINFAEVPPPPPPPEQNLADESYTFIPYDEPPQMIGGMAALLKKLEYPELARKAGIEGMVIIGVLVDEKGNSVKTQVLKSDGSKLGFEEAAQKALMQMKWKPAFQRDKPVKVWISIPVRFRLKDIS